MSVRFTKLVLALGLAAALTGVSRAADDDPVTSEAKTNVEYFDNYAPKTKDLNKYSALLADLARIPHQLTVDRVGKVLLKDGDDDHKMMAASTLADFKKPTAVREAAGKYLVKGVEQDFSVDVTDSCVDSIGKLKYTPGVLCVIEVMKKESDPWLLVTAVRCCGRLEDKRALPQLLMMWEKFPVGDSWEGGETSYDSGTAGDGDQKEAERQYHEKYGNQQRKGKPPMMLKAYIQELRRSVVLITKDETIKKPAHLRAWMEAHADELAKLGVEIPKKSGPDKKPKDEDKKKDDDKKDDKKKDDK
jgi:hypothetical protein